MALLSTVRIVLVLGLISVFSQSRAADRRLVPDFDERVVQLLKDNGIPGMAVAVVDRDSILSLKGYGLRNLEKQSIVTPRTLFAIGSATKAFTATALAILADEKKIDLDAPLVRQRLKDFKTGSPLVNSLATPRDLLLNRTGLQPLDMLWFGTTDSRADLFRKLSNLAARFDFRTTWQNNNLMYAALGILIERNSGNPWEEFVRERMFSPLRMNRSNFSVSASLHSDDFATPYREKAGKLTEVTLRNIDAIAPSGGINSSAEEMVRWVQMNLASGIFNGGMVVSEKAMQQILSPQILVNDNPNSKGSYEEIRAGDLGPTAYGLGWYVEQYRSHRLIHHSGNSDGFVSEIGFLPEDNLGVIVLINGRTAHDTLPFLVSLWIYDQMLGLEPIDWFERHRTVVARKAEEPKGEDENPPQPPPLPLISYCGRYVNAIFGVLDVKLSEEKLKVEFRGETSELNFTGDKYFAINLPLKLKRIYVRMEKGKGRGLEGLEIAMDPLDDKRAFFKRSSAKK